MNTTMNTKSFILLAGLVLAGLIGSVAYGQTLILADNYNVANVNSGFALGEIT